MSRQIQLTEGERDAMREAGAVNARLMDEVREIIKPGISTAEIDSFVHEWTIKNGHVPACLGYQGFPKSCCTSINEVICHGIPSDYRLNDGDIVNIDLTTIVDGWHGDQSETFLIGNVSDEARQLTQCAFDCMHLAIQAIRPNSRISEIGYAIQEEAHRRGFSVVQEYVGHGLGQKFHQEPSIPHYPTKIGNRERIVPGTCFTIEPMINSGQRFTVLDPEDGWTVRTRDSSLSAQFEHTILMTEDGPEILTLTQKGPQSGDKF